MNSLQLTKTPLDIAAISNLVSDESCGAISLFIGTTRDNFDSNKVISLEYEAYDAMALKQMESICEEIRSRWKDVCNIAIYHRLGKVPVKEASVIIAISSPHRQSSLESVDFAINKLKSRVPIWKKELYDNDNSAWKENKESSSSSNIALKRHKLQFGNCGILDEHVPQNLVQIAVNADELQRRIQCFIEKKREEIDASNVIDFTSSNQLQHNNHEISGCARTNSLIVKQEHSKCHLRVRKVYNRIGPQTRPDYLQTLDKLMVGKTYNTNIKQENNNEEVTGLLNRRIADVEEYLDLPNSNKDFYKRIKLIENRLLHLESISPEYKHFLKNATTSPLSGIHLKKEDSSKLEQFQRKRKSYSVNDLNFLIEQIENDESNDT